MTPGRTKAEEVLSVMNDIADDLLLEAGEAAVEEFWGRMDEFFVRRRSSAIVDAIVTGMLRDRRTGAVAVATPVPSLEWDERLLAVLDEGPWLRPSLLIGGAWNWLRRRIGAVAT